MEARLSSISKTAPAFSAVLRTYRQALANNDGMLAEGLISWLAGQPNVAASVKRAAGIKGDLDHFGASNFLVSLLTILRNMVPRSRIGAGRGGNSAAHAY